MHRKRAISTGIATLLVACSGVDIEIGGETIGTTERAAVFASLPAFPFLELPIEIVNVNSGKCLNVAGTPGNNANVDQVACNGSKVQTWFLGHLSGSTYQIRSAALGGKNLDIAGGSTADNANVQIFDVITGAQVFGFEPGSGGEYAIVSNHSAKCLDVANASTASGANVHQFTCDGRSSQRWLLRPRIVAFHLIAKHSEKCLDVAGASTANHANVQQFRCFPASNQRWSAHPAGFVNGVQFYSIVSNGSGKCLDVAGASTADHANVQQFTCQGGANQKWSIVEEADGHVTIRNQFSNKCLDVAGLSTADNANVQQFTCNGGSNQRWYWSSYAQRHLQVVQVARSSGADRTLADDAVVQKHVAKANSIYKRYGTEIVYDPAVDKSNVNSDALFNLGGGGSFNCPNQTVGTDVECAERLASLWQGKIVVFTRPGGAFSSGDAKYIAIGKLDDEMKCTNVPNTQWLAHEFGHYMGLPHPFLAFGTNAEASEFLRSAGSASIFDGDKIGDTNPDPMISGNECLGPNSPTAVVTLTGNAGPVNFTVQTNNVVSYYYNVSPTISVRQAALTRATSYARWF